MSNRKKLAVIGNGMLGHDIALAAGNSGRQVSVYDLPEFDLTDEKQLKQVVDSADCIVNCAAYTNVDKAESEEALCMAVNAEAPGKLGDFAAANGKYLVHISTDFVFGDLTDAPQKESDPTNPLSVYGRSKLIGEEKLLASGCRCGIIRVQWSYGINGNNFITKILELAKKLPKLKVVDDQTGAPTRTRDMARAVMDFLDNETEGLYHFAASGYTTRFETAGEIVRHFKLDTELTPCKSEEFPAPAARPHNSKFDCSKIDKVLSFKRPEWRDSLKQFFSEIK
ncbi:MAG: dTDP-4-dehydrorhamnose reductase [Victivallaceae bacterium]|jgi:dTDP-4-dehydrorhamnose reductase